MYMVQISPEVSYPVHDYNLASVLYTCTCIFMYVFIHVCAAHVMATLVVCLVVLRFKYCRIEYKLAKEWVSHDDCMATAAPIAHVVFTQKEVISYSVAETIALHHRH